MATTPIDRPIERDHRGIIYDNRRWECFSSRPGDIFVCTPAKCGTTWMQTIIAALLFPDGAPGPVTEVAPWLEARFNPLDGLLARLDAQTHRRSIKTHSPAFAIPWYSTASYIVVGRDGRDAFMSFLNHMRNMRHDVVMDLVATAAAAGIELGAPPPLDDVHEFFAWWIERAFWFEHMASFWEHRHESNVLFAHFNDMSADLKGEMRRVADFLGIEIDEQRLPDLANRCTLASMKRRATEIGDFDTHFVGGAESFFYKGANRRWVGVLTDDELAAFDRRAAEFLPPDAIAWTERGGSVSDSRPHEQRDHRRSACRDGSAD